MRFEKDCLLSKKSFRRSYLNQQESEDLKDWLVKLVVHFERDIEQIIKRKIKKLKKLCTKQTSNELVDERFLEHFYLSTFFTDPKTFCDDFSPDIVSTFFH